MGASQGPAGSCRTPGWGANNELIKEKEDVQGHSRANPLRTPLYDCEKGDEGWEAPDLSARWGQEYRVLADLNVSPALHSPVVGHFLSEPQFPRGDTYPTLGL